MNDYLTIKHASRIQFILCEYLSKCWKYEKHDGNVIAFKKTMEASCRLNRRWRRHIVYSPKMVIMALHFDNPMFAEVFFYLLTLHNINGSSVK